VEVPPTPAAFGIPGATQIKESGAPILKSGTSLQMRVGGTFCIPPTGTLLDLEATGPAAISAQGSLDFSSALPLLPTP
jgi:hypothetical protein